MKLHILQNASQYDDEIANSQENATSSVESQLQQQQLISRNLEFENSMALDRAIRVENIERDVLDINQIMVDLNTMVEGQSEDIGFYLYYYLSFQKQKSKLSSTFSTDAIESNVERATGSVEDGLLQLNQAARSQAKYRKKVMCLLLIAIVLGLVVTGIIVSSLRS